MMVGGVAAAAAVRTFPFRVFSFPSQIAEPSSFLTSGKLNAPSKLFVEVWRDLIVEPEWDSYMVAADNIANRMPLFHIPKVHGPRATVHGTQVMA
jgi:hypothetical protein